LVAAVEQDRDKFAFELKLAVDKGNAAAFVSFLVFDAIADTKFASMRPTVSRWTLILAQFLLDKDQHFLDNRWGPFVRFP
jgi:hypothetical protein